MIYARTWSIASVQVLGIGGRAEGGGEEGRSVGANPFGVGGDPLLLGQVGGHDWVAVLMKLIQDVRHDIAMIHVIATIETAPGRRDDFLAAFHEIVPEVRAEEGCIEYGPAIDQAVTIGNPPAIPRDDFVTVIEKWSSVEALLTHHVAPHMQRYGRTVKEIVKRVEIRVLEPA
jgi:quinol monooxygenase YgiN